jgi:hypothetical protein
VADKEDVAVHIPAVPRSTDGFVCSICGETLEIFTKATAPTYRMISEPIRQSSSE